MIGRLLLTAGLALYAFAAYGSGIDRISGRSPAVERLVPPPFRAQADRSAAAIAIARQQYPAAIAHARAAIAHDPVDVDSAALLGSANLNAGRNDEAARAFRVAARFGWRNVETQLYIYVAALQVGDYRVAADRLDAVLRTQPGLPQENDLLEQLETTPQGRKLLIEHLNGQPRWLAEYLWPGPDASDELIDRRFTVLTDAAARGPAFTCERIAPFTKVLLRENRRSDAEKLWNADCPRQRVGGLVVDPQFRSVDDADNLPFGWDATRTGDVSVRSEQDGAATRLAIGNRSSTTQEALRQPSDLQPGTYRVKAVVEGAAAPGASRVFASVACDSDRGFPNTLGPDVSGTGQVLQVGRCSRQALVLWATPGQRPALLKAIALEKID